MTPNVEVDAMKDCFYMLEGNHRKFDGRTNNTVMLRIREGDIDELNFCKVDCFKRFLKEDLWKIIDV